MSCSEGQCSCGKNNHKQHAVRTQGILNSETAIKLTTQGFSGNFTQLIPENEIVEVRFKNGRKSYFRNRKRININRGDRVVVDLAGGFDIGTVSLLGQSAINQLNKLAHVKDISSLKEIIRLAQSNDIESWLNARKMDLHIIESAIILSNELNLNVGFVNAECRADMRKVVIYYTGESKISPHFKMSLMETSGMEVDFIQYEKN